ncbi:pickpocket protein 28-like isoform X2 [Thrips palmi]|uniref:Pickpocket protein 28-like isoform X2 n=1 Tax=Thrips palmi TaxID=161013 RepID=A0A6P9AFB5_THRPL|nr:pickpocket protein 28-like isoform X2 [Thrips palmi]
MVRVHVGFAQEQGLSSLSKTSSHSLFGGPHSIQAEKCRREAKLTCRTICRDYCNNTAVHGFRYFFEKGRSVQERTFWVFGVFLCFTVSLYLISKVWTKWETCPVIVTFADQPTPVWSVPFPAVTICPSTKTKPALFNYTLAQHHVLDNVSTEEEFWKYQALSLICIPQAMPPNYHLNATANDFLVEVAPTMEEVILECYWQHRQLNCSKHFMRTLTEEGVCFTFNGLSPHEIYTNETQESLRGPSEFPSSGWSVDGGYDDGDATIKRYYPRRQQFVGADTGFRVILQSADADMDYVCKGCEQGFRVYLHSPAHAPSWTRHYSALPLNTSMYLLASPALMTTTDGLKDYSPERRSCYFPTERKLRYYRYYSMESCIYECFTNMTQRRCGCAPIGLPIPPGVPMCSIFSQCNLKTYVELLDEAEKVPFDGPIPQECHCLPSCKTLHYHGEATSFDFPWNMERIARRMPSTPQGLSRSQLNVYFDTLQFVTSQRRELYGHTDFLANTGGLLGLFTGFSVISLVELFYYVSLRLWCDVKRRAEERRRRDGN